MSGKDTFSLLAEGSWKARQEEEEERGATGKGSEKKGLRPEPELGHISLLQVSTEGRAGAHRQTTPGACTLRDV